MEDEKDIVPPKDLEWYDQETESWKPSIRRSYVFINEGNWQNHTYRTRQQYIRPELRKDPILPVPYEVRPPFLTEPSVSGPETTELERIASLLTEWKAVAQDARARVQELEREVSDLRIQLQLQHAAL